MPIWRALVVNSGSTGGTALVLDPPTFNADRTKYTVRVANGVDTVEVATGDGRHEAG